MKYALNCLFFLLIFLPNNSFSVPVSCASEKRSIPLETKLASAGLTANIFGTESSIKGVAKALFANAINHSSPDLSLNCPTQCGKPESRIFLKAVPTKFLSEYEDIEKCSSYLKSTENNPLRFEGFSFANVDEFADSFGEFSRGKGPKGEELYEKCDGECSPQFTLKIKTLDDGTYMQDADVVCGHARDQDDDTYTVSTTLVVNCG